MHRVNQDTCADATQPQLCHEDLHGYNILVRKERDKWLISALLDFDKAWAGSGESDLARLALWTGMTSDSFWYAYRRQHTLDPLFEQRKLIFQLIWCLEYAEPSKRHLQDTQNICRQLGIQPIKTFDFAIPDAPLPP